MWMAGLCFSEQCSQFSHIVMILFIEKLSLLRCDALLLGEWFLIFQRIVVLDSEIEGPIILQNVRHNYPPDTVSHPCTLQSSVTLLWEPKISQFCALWYKDIVAHDKWSHFLVLFFILWLLVISASSVVASKKVGLMISAEKTKCMFVLSEQNAR